jgi:hypothetical protein
VTIVCALPGPSPRVARGSQRSRARGFALIYITAVVLVLLLFGSLAVDFGRVQVAKTRLRAAIDSAARFGVQAVPAGAQAVLDRCNQVGGDNLVDGQNITFSASDVVLGNWNPQSNVFSANGAPTNAVRVSKTLNISLLFGGIIQMSSCPIRASAVVSSIPMGIIGLNQIDFKNNTYVASYNSSVRLNPSQGNANANAWLGSNGSVGEQNNGDIHGACVVGPSGSVDPSWKPTAGTVHLTSPIPTPVEPAWNPTGGNPTGVPQSGTYTVNAVTSLPAGTYWLSGLTVNNHLNFTGPATLIVNGNIDINSQVNPYGSLPGNLTVYQIGPSRSFTAGGQFTGKIVAPRSDFTTGNSGNNFRFYGVCVFNSITVKNNSQFYQDESIAASVSAGLVQ